MHNADRTMKNIVLNYHLFQLDTIINEYESRLINPDTVLKENNHETQESIQHLFCANDVYKLFDKALSHLVIEFLLLTSFSEFIKRHFSKQEEFDNMTGHIYSLMIVDTCNTSSAIAI